MYLIPTSSDTRVQTGRRSLVVWKLTSHPAGAGGILYPSATSNITLLTYVVTVVLPVLKVNVTDISDTTLRIEVSSYERR